MAHDHLDMHIVLNEDSIDLRQETFEKLSSKNRSPRRTTSHQVISPSQISGELKDRKPLVNGLRKLANNLYYGEQSHMLQKNKILTRPKQRNRATSADPRFRRERSPIYSKEASQTQSDSQVMDLPTQFKKKKTKTHSDTKFIIESTSTTKRTIPKPNGPYPADQSEPINCKPNVNSEVKHSPRHEDYFRKTISDKNSIKYGGVGNIYSYDTLTQSNMEQSTMTEEIKSTPTAMDCKSLYQSAMTDIDIAKNNSDTAFCHTTGQYLDDKETSNMYFKKQSELENLSRKPMVDLATRRLNTSYSISHADSDKKPFWDDPRLIEKYSRLLKPVSVHKSKSSLTLPLTKPIPNSIHTSTKSRPSTCTRCVCANLCSELEGVYPPYEEISENTINYEKIKTKLYNTMRSNYYLAAFFMIGSVCGLLLVTLVVWVLANDIIWSYLGKQEPPKLTGLKWLSAYIGGAILHSIHIVFNTFYYMITVPRNEVFDLLKIEEAT
ncbi:hypothetical protein QE152_g7588 [Popillia japonica]|uniref:Uncharacterized protein n=1 Tax=Popillia japonica TaxID=7064 RepID=A0AAW1MAE1_POPJA